MKDINKENLEIKLSLEDSFKILSQMKNFIGKIYKDNDEYIGIGIFIKIKINNNMISFIMTNKNINFKNTKYYKILLKNDSSSIKIKINNSSLIYKLNDLDISFIEIKSRNFNNINNDIFELDEKYISQMEYSNNNNNNIIDNQLIYVLFSNKEKKTYIFYGFLNGFENDIANLKFEIDKEFFCLPILSLKSKKLIGLYFRNTNNNNKKDSFNNFPIKELYNIINNEITIKYDISNDKRIKLFGSVFVKNNKDKCRLIINDKEQEIVEYLDISNFDNLKKENENYNKNIVEIKLKFLKNIHDISYMFSKSSISFLTNVSKWNTINITDMSHLFDGCSKLTSLPDISDWNTTNVINMKGMFKNCSSLTSLPEISKWDTNKVENMSYMFFNCKRLSTLPNISKWITNNLTDISNMFSNCLNLISLPDISKWNTSDLINMSYAFSGCSNLISFPDISKWNLNNVKNFKNIYYGCDSFLSIPINNKYCNNKMINLNEIFIPKSKSLNEQNINKSYNLLDDLPDFSVGNEEFEESVIKFYDCKNITTKNTNINSTTELDGSIQNSNVETIGLNIEDKEKNKSKSNLIKNSILLACKSICKIIISNVIGSGFLVKSEKGNKPFYCLMTCEHLITKKIIESKTEIDICYDNQNYFIKIKLDENDRFIRDYSVINMDITIVEIKKDEIPEELFLPLKDINKNEDLKKEKIYILQYPEGKDLIYSLGSIIETNDYTYEFSHSASTEKGSSGSPIILEGTLNVIGVHKQGLISKKENYGTLIYPIIKSLKKSLKYEKKTYRNDIYEGEFKNDLREGYGKYIYKDGSYYIGEWKKNLKNGKGILYYNNNKKKYEGNFKDDKFYGFGKYIYEDGSYYIGNWKYNLKDNKGTMFYNDNTIQYTGEYYNDKFEGYGIYNYQNGDYYDGKWESGKKNGEGILYNKKDKIIYMGYFNDNFPVKYKIIDENDKLYFSPNK